MTSTSWPALLRFYQCKCEQPRSVIVETSVDNVEWNFYYAIDQFYVDGTKQKKKKDNSIYHPRDVADNNKAVQAGVQSYSVTVI